MLSTKTNTTKESIKSPDASSHSFSPSFDRSATKVSSSASSIPEEQRTKIKSYLDLVKKEPTFKRVNSYPFT